MNLKTSNKAIKDSNLKFYFNLNSFKQSTTLFDDPMLQVSPRVRAPSSIAPPLTRIKLNDSKFLAEIIPNLNQMVLKEISKISNFGKFSIF